MTVAKNMKELEKMIVDEMIKQMPKLTKEYCHKWYKKHAEMNDIMPA